MKPSPGHTTGRHLPTWFVLPKGIGRAVGRGPPSPTVGWHLGKACLPAFFLAWAHVQPGETTAPQFSEGREKEYGISTSYGWTGQSSWGRKIPRYWAAAPPERPLSTPSGSPWPVHPPPLQRQRVPRSLGYGAFFLPSAAPASASRPHLFTERFPAGASTPRGMLDKPASRGTLLTA